VSSDSQPASVSITQGPEAITFATLNANGRVTTTTFRRYLFSWSEERFDDIFNCYSAANGARLGFFSRHVSGEGYIIASKSVDALIFLLKATDGSLVIQQRTDTLVMSQALIGTSFHANSVWWRYPPLNAAH
jgi:hypothetical protein